ncbi:MAG: RpiB/LacA/LacB family sugar-phosphate isomerase [Candidatus Pacebacteria bacterium]|nr:RpiB/LacA/LacB family sugar-phosphate isomerase [Candidatus Paceibacterota bacterium]
MIYISSDHRGFKLKEDLKKELKRIGEDFKDLGPFKFKSSDDYPDFAKKVAQKISKNPEQNRGILICGSSVGMLIVANKFKNVRAAPAINKEIVRMSKSHNNSNILCFAADFISVRKAKKLLDIWLKEPFSQDIRHKRRLEKIQKIEKENFK